MPRSLMSMLIGLLLPRYFDIAVLAVRILRLELALPLAPLASNWNSVGAQGAVGEREERRTTCLRDPMVVRIYILTLHIPMYIYIYIYLIAHGERVCVWIV